jgi:LysR family transcriptional regulator, nitrogen assimilation regulatory protein
MHFRQLRYFVKIVEAGSFSRAASLIHVAQPALSQQIAELEERMGVNLLQRSARGVRPTAAGEVLYREASSILKQLERLPGIVRSSNGVVQGTVSLGIASLLGPTVVGSFVEACKSGLEKVSLKLAVSDSAALRHKLGNQALDLAVVFEDELDSVFTRQPLYRQRMYLFYPQAMGKLASSVSLSELAALPLILPSHPNLARGSLDRTFARVGLVPNLVAEVDDFSSILSTVRTGLGTSIFPKGDLSELGEGIAGPALLEPPLYMTVSILSSNDRPLTHAAEAVRGLLQGFIESHVRRGQSPGAEWLN